jgi:hypothetical protein
MRISTFLSATGLVWGLLGSPAWAQPAPWHWWISKHDGQRVCAQFMPRQGWQRGEGPFANARCQPARSALIHAR